MDQVLGTSEWVKTSALNPYFQNARVGNIPLIVESLKRHGQYKPLLVNVGTKTGRPLEVLAGNQTLAGLLQIGRDDVLVFWLDVDDDEARRIVLVDNRASDKGTYDSELLAGMLLGLDGDMGGTGYSAADLSRLLNGLGAGEQSGLTDVDAVPDVPIVPRTEADDVWLLGKHRLVCGNSRFVETMRKVVGGQAPVDAVWTDPPYNVDYVGKTAAAMKIKGDKMQPVEFEAMLSDMFVSALSILREGAPVYVSAPPGPDLVAFYKVLGASGYLLRQNLVWVKNALVLGRSDYHYKHEPILELETPDASEVDPDDADVSRETMPAFEVVEGPDGDQILAPEIDPATHEGIAYGFVSGAPGRLGRGSDNWYGDNKQTTVFEVAKPPASREHPTMKPVELIASMLRNSVARGGTVLDFCAGSGSTLIAAHQLNLTAYLIEIDPVYCDVICRRYQEHTGIMPILERTGKGVDFTKAPAK